MKKNLSKAFSLLEASIALVVIGIIIFGITQSSRLIRKVKISSAQSFTASSEAAAIHDMSLWLETTIEKNISSAARSGNAQDQDKIKSWNDYNTQAIQADKINATQSSNAAQPTYIEDGIGGLPAVSFDGVDDYLAVRNFCANSFTIFVVLKTDKIGGADSASAPVLWSGAFGASNDVAPLMINQTNPSMKNGGNYFLTTTNKSVVTDSAHVIMVSRNLNSGAREIWVDGVNSANDSGGSAGVLLNAGSDILIGSNLVDNLSFKGAIGEIMAFERNLEIAERQTVEKYLSKKWKVKVAVNN